MGEINKIGSNPFEVKIQHMAPDRRSQKDPSITDEENQGGASQQQTGSSSSQPQAKQNQGMTNMLETLRKRQEEENYNEYVDNRSELQRERARQASKEYLKNLNEFREEQADKADKLVEKEKDFSKTYTSRLQDISQKHVAKILKHKNEDKLFEKSKDLLDDGSKNSNKKQSNLSSARAKTRPEINQLLTSRSEESKSKQNLQAASPDTEQPNENNRTMLNNAVNKMRMKLGGAHTNPNKGIPGELNPILKQPGAEFQSKAESHSFRPDLAQVKHSMEHSKALAEDPNRYVPLEEADIQRMLYEHKLPMHQGTVQSLLLASQKLRDSSHHFLKAALLVTTAELNADTNLMRTVVEALRTFEKFPRQSIIHKLLRYIMAAKAQQTKAQFQNLQPQNVPAPVEEDDLILLQTQSVPNFKGGKGKLTTGLPAQLAPLPTGPDRSKSPLYQSVEREQLKILTPEEIAKAYEESPDIHPLHEEIAGLLKQYGLPTSKVMVQQLLQSAQGNPTKAQAMAIQLSLGQPLSGESLQNLVLKLTSLTQEDRQLPLPELLKRLDLPVPENLADRLQNSSFMNTSQRLSPQQQRQWKNMLSGAMNPLRPLLEGASLPTKEAILLMQTLAERTETLSSLLPRLQQALRQNPNATLAQIEKMKPELEKALYQLEIPAERTLKPESKQALVKAFAQSLQTGSNPNIVSDVLKNLQWQRPTVLPAESMQPEDWHLPEMPIAKMKPEELLTPKTSGNWQEKLPENTQKLLEKMPLSRQALQLLENLGMRTGIEASLFSRLESRLNIAQPQTVLQRMEHLSPLLKQGLAQLKNLPGQILMPDSQQQLLHVISQQLDKGGQAYLLPRVLADLHWAQPGTESAQNPAPLAKASSQVMSNPTLQRVLQQPTIPTTAAPLLPTPELSKEEWAAQLLGFMKHLPQEQKQVARESLLILAQLSERTQTLQDLLPRISQLVQSQPQLTARNLQSMQPALINALDRYLAAGALPLPKSNQETLVDLVTRRLQLQTNLPANAEQNQMTQLWNRFYASEMPLPLQQILNGNEAQQGFVSLHQLFQDFDLSGYWQASAQKLWSQPPPELGARLAQLPLLLQPALAHLETYPQQQWLLSSPLQNRLAQAMNQFLSQGQPEALQSALVRVMTENPNLRDPLALVQERLKLWGLNAEPAMAQHLWQMAAGSRDRLDALALLSKGNYPLIKANIDIVLSYIKGQPPQNRFQSASQILAFLSPKLIKLINQELQMGQSNLAATAEQNEAELHFLSQFMTQPIPGNESRIRSLLIGQTNPFAGLLGLENEIAQIIPILAKVPSTQVQVLSQWLQTLQSQLRQLQDILSLLRGRSSLVLTDLEPLRQLATQMQASFLQFEDQIEGEIQLLPRSGDILGRLPAQLQKILSELLKTQALPRDLSFLTRSFGQKLGGLAPALAQFFQTLESYSEQIQLPSKQAFSVSAFGEELSETQQLALAKLQGLPEDHPRLRNYLQALGIQVNDPGDLQHILNLAEGSQDRLDAIGLLLRNQMPLIPAHIQILAEYVRLLPPQERFKSISQILLYLSDALLAKMKEQLQQTGKQSDLNQLLKPQGWQLEEKAEETAQQLLKQLPGDISEETFEGLRYLLQSALPKTPQILEKIQQLMHTDLNPRSLLQPIQEPLAHLLGLLQACLPASARYTQLAQAFLVLVQNHLQQWQQLLSPAQQAQLGPWLIGLTDQLQELESAFTEKLDLCESELAAEGGEIPQEGDSWLSRILKQFKGIAGQIARKRPELQAETQQILRRFQQEVNHLEEQLSSLQLYMQSDQGHLAQNDSPLAKQQTNQPQLLVPVFIQSLGYPVEISIRQQSEESSGRSSEGATVIHLNIRTHTLGTLVFSLNLRGKNLIIRLGVEKHTIKEWLQPYLDALQQKLGEFPFEIQSIQSYVVSNQNHGHNIIARQMRTRYRRSAIDAL
jgi:hypothetical protein